MLRGDRFRKLQCFFGGGSAISLQLAEYRESVDIDFLCKDEGFHEMQRGVYYFLGLFNPSLPAYSTPLFFLAL